MRKWFCDKCGKEITDEEGDYGLEFKVGDLEEGYLSDEVEYCKECFDAQYHRVFGKNYVLKNTDLD